MSADYRFDDHAETYDATVQRAIRASGESVQYFADLKVRLMAEFIEPQTVRRVLDFGCGIGNTTRSIAARLPQAAVTGVDSSEESVSIAARHPIPNAQIDYVAIDASGLPFENGSFDIAFTACVFHHIEPRDRLHWARELVRVLAPSGRLFVFEHNPLNPLTVQVVRNVPFDQGVALLRATEVRQLLARAGLATAAPHFYFFFPSALRVLRPFEPALRRVPFGAQYFVVGRGNRNIGTE